MAVDGSHAGCFQHGPRLYVVPSDSEYTVDEVAQSFAEASRIRLTGHRIRLHWTAFIGAVVGGLFLDVSAWHSSGLVDGHEPILGSGSLGRHPSQDGHG
jgi:hypothetical protein